MPYSIDALNQMSQIEFVRALGEIFEQTPAIAQSVWHDRPFESVEDLHQKMTKIINALDLEAQIALITAHPDLGSKAKMADASIKEQAGAGLDRLTPSEYERFQSLNQAYKARFGFPFIVAVKNHTKTSILAAFEERLQHSKDEERQRAIAEISQIAYFRLIDQVKP